MRGKQLLPAIWTCSGRERAPWWRQSATPPPLSPPSPPTSWTALPGASSRSARRLGPSCRWWTRCSPIWNNPGAAAVRSEWPWHSRRMSRGSKTTTAKQQPPQTWAQISSPCVRCRWSFSFGARREKQGGGEERRAAEEAGRRGEKRIES